MDPRRPYPPLGISWPANRQEGRGDHSRETGSFECPCKPELDRRIPASLRVTNPERVIDPSTGFTKIDLVRYYGLVGPLMMEHLKGRPVSLVRAPDGIRANYFFRNIWKNTICLGCSA